MEMGSMTSRPRENTIGVFQGGSLSCILYMLFANDLSLHMPDGVTIVQFADDTQILVTGKKRELANIISLMETALDTAYRWFCHNGMKAGMRSRDIFGRLRLRLRLRGRISAPAPAPAPSKTVRRLRLRLRLREKCTGSGGSGSGSGSDDQVLI